MAQIIFHESYGDVTRAELAAIRKYNVSPSDHEHLTRAYGDDHAKITEAIKAYTRNGMFSWMDFEGAQDALRYG